MKDKKSSKKDKKKKDKKARKEARKQRKLEEAKHDRIDPKSSPFPSKIRISTRKQYGAPKDIYGALEKDVIDMLEA